MLGKSHAITGAAAWCMLGSTIQIMTQTGDSVPKLIAGGVVCAGASVFPDLDTPKSTIANSLGPLTRVLSQFIAKISGGHRHGTHSIIGIFLTTFLAMLAIDLGAMIVPWALTVFFTSLALMTLKNMRGLHCIVSACVLGSILFLVSENDYTWLVVAIATGCVFHIIGDMLTPQGVPLLYPFSQKSLSIPVIGHTGDWREKIIAGAAGLLILWVLFSSLPSANQVLPQVEKQASMHNNASQIIQSTKELLK